MDLLPNIQVDLLQEDPEPLEEENVSDDEGEPELVVKEVIDQDIPDVLEKQLIPEEDIFVEKKPKKAPPQKKEKKKRVMTEEQLERLKKGREKALAVRRAKAQEKKELKELQTKKKKKELQKLREEVDDTPKPKTEPAPAPRKTISSLEDLPADMLIELQKRAIEGYDTKRKARKEEKRKQQSQKTDNLKNINLVNNALKPQIPKQYGEAGYFNDCF